MEIHRPKAVHSWRELLKEIGIIVIGVVIALGAEQAVESLHWMRQVDVGDVREGNHWAAYAMASPARKWSLLHGGHFAPARGLLGQYRMNEDTRLSPLQRVRTRLHLFLTAVRKRLTVGVPAVLVDGDKVLLVKHTYTPGWQFPGGGVEPGETAEAAAAREALEETGYLAEGRPQLAGLYLNRIAGGRRDHVALYVWHSFRKQRPFRPNLEIAQCQWFDMNDLPPDVGQGTARRIREIVEGTPPAAEW